MGLPTHALPAADVLMAEKFILEQRDKTSPTWLKLVKHLEGRRDVYRGQLEGDLDEVTTTKIRGRIAILKELISLGNEERSTD